MITKRGPNNILVVERTAVPVAEVCSELIRKETFSEVTETFPVNKEEILECIDIFCSGFGPRENDFLEVICTVIEGDIELETVGLSDWVYLSLVELGVVFLPETDDLMELYVKGLEQVMYDCLTDKMAGLKDFRNSGVHDVVFTGFEEAYGKIDKKEAEKLLKLLDFVLVDGDNDEQ